MAEKELYHLLVSTLPIGFLRVDTEGSIIDFNPAAETITGYTKEEVVGRLLAGKSGLLTCPSRNTCT